MICKTVRFGISKCILYPSRFQAALRMRQERSRPVGFTIVRITTDDGIEGFGVTYHEVGGEATKLMIEKNIKPQADRQGPV